MCLFVLFRYKMQMLMLMDRTKWKTDVCCHDNIAFAQREHKFGGLHINIVLHSSIKLRQRCESNCESNRSRYFILFHK